MQPQVSFLTHRVAKTSPRQDSAPVIVRKSPTCTAWRRIVGVVIVLTMQPVLAEQADSDASTPSQISASLPKGAIIAFMPRLGDDYGSMSELRGWLKQRGWAICDGESGTPNLRDRMLLGTTEAATVGQRLGSWDHEHRVQGETKAPVRRNRNTPTGRQQLVQIPDDQHRHRVDLRSDKAAHLPPSMRVLFIMKVR